jgi:hypothetical protein
MKGKKMPNITFNLRPTTTLLFFAGAIMISYFAFDKPYLVHFARSAAWWFEILGPLQWVQDAIGDIRTGKNYKDGSPERIRHMNWYWVIGGIVAILTIIFAITGADGLLDGIRAIPPKNAE